ncbi:MAG: hypothetical protein ACHREM_03755, partial [Polyangiales bacterium]
MLAPALRISFSGSGTAWTLQSEVTGSDSVANDGFGYALAMSGKSAIVAAYAHAAKKGSAYAYAGQLTNGSLCGLATDCQSGFCVDGFCCNSACTGQCQACDLNPGTCAPIGGTPHGVRAACPNTGATVCGQTACDGTIIASCAKYPNGSSVACAGPTCANGVLTAGSNCDGSGNCVATASSSCSPYVCNTGGTACTATCASDSQCAANYYCGTGGVCTKQLTNGTACSAGDQCTSGACADGFCCDSACAGQCQACDSAGSRGTCVTVSGTPHGTRAACGVSGTAPCGQLTCDGSTPSSCAGYANGSGISCGSATCVGSSLEGAPSCDGHGNCVNPAVTSCGLYSCSGGACRTFCALSTDCAAGSFCSGNTCLALVGNGGACASASQCASNFCVDGVCCNSACGGQCQACNTAGAYGTCSPVAGAPRSGRPACSTGGANVCAATTCDGVTTASCAGYANGSSTACGAAACASGVATIAGTCDGHGSCSQASVNCSPYSCNATTCKSSCTLPTDCATGFVCAAGACTATTGLGTACATSASCATGYCTDGVCCGVVSCGTGSSCNYTGHAGSCEKQNGTACATNAECGSGNCIDGVCCNTACTGQCSACDVVGSVGTCSAVSGSPHGARTACSGSSTSASCATTCNGADTT